MLVCSIDSRHKPQKIDMEFMQWLGENNIPFVMCFTKQDKLSKLESAKNLAHYKKEMKQIWQELPPIFLTLHLARKGKTKCCSLLTKQTSSFKIEEAFLQNAGKNHAYHLPFYLHL